MNMKPQLMTVRHSRAVRFPVAVQPREQAKSTNLELTFLKERLLSEALADKADEAQKLWLSRAAQEAASLAWSTPFPLLVLPELFAEKARAAQQYLSRQTTVRERSPDLMALAA